MIDSNRPKPIGHEDLSRFWVGAGHLKVGDTVKSSNGTGLVRKVLTLEKPEEMYNLTVDEAHTYFVGDGKWLVHNGSPCDRLVIGKIGDLPAPRDGRKNEYTILNLLPDQGSPQANWQQNSSVLRQQMSTGNPIRDASVNPVTGALQDNSGFLRMERDVLLNRGWTYNPYTRLWSPPK